VDQCFCFSVHWLPDRDYSNCHRSEQYIAAWVGLKVNMAHFEFRIPISWCNFVEILETLDMFLILDSVR
jgi:hypothetical protein